MTELKMDHNTFLSRLVHQSPVLKIFTDSSQNIPYCVHSIQGDRNYMEDTYYIDTSPDIQFYGVFDGHGGDNISNYLRDNFGQQLLTRLRMLPNLNNSEEVKHEIYETFLSFDHELYLRRNGDAGSTAVIAIRIGNKVYLGNLGDSRCIIFAKEGRLLVSTRDHKPNNERERERICKAGGYVYSGRVDGNLAVSRAFGDFSLKIKNGRYMGLESKVSPSPDIYEIEIVEPVIIFLASDGLWDKVSENTVIKMAERCEFEFLASSLVNLSYKLKSSDNITVVAVKLS